MNLLKRIWNWILAMATIFSCVFAIFAWQQSNKAVELLNQKVEVVARQSENLLAIIENIQPQDVSASLREELRTATEMLANPVTADDFFIKAFAAQADGNYNNAIKYYKKVIELAPKNVNAYNNLGLIFGELAATKSGTEADKLFKQAFEKFQKAIQIEPDYHLAYHCWGAFLLAFSKTKTGNEAEKLFKEAFEKCQKSVDLGGNNYNLACCYAIMKNKEKALFYLEKSVEQKEFPIDFVLNDEDWKFYFEDEDFKKIIEKYKS